MGAKPGQWWPPVVLGPGWVSDHADEADLLHLHFGLESFATSDLVSAVDSAHAAGWPVVYTLHDLVNPQVADQAEHERHLDALVPLVDAVITLTPGAASTIAQRWHRDPLVLVHPRLLEGDIALPTGLRNELPVIGVYLKDLRPNVDGPGIVRMLAGALDQLRDTGSPAVGEVRLQRHVRDEAARDQVRELCAGRDDIVLIEHDRLDDAALANALSHLDVCVLPYRQGTHSGWLELCWDLGVAVAAPEVGFFSEQHQDPTVASFAWDATGETLARALGRLLKAAPPSGTEERQRLRQARRTERLAADSATAAAHVELFRTLIRGRIA